MQDYSLFHRWMQKVASSRPGAWFFSRTQHISDGLFRKLPGGRTTITTILAGLPVVFVTSTGAKSGLPRTTPVLPVPDEQHPERFALVATNWGQRHYPSWYFNLKKNPRATCSLRGREGAYLAREIEGEEYERLWQSALKIYAGFPLYQERVGKRHIPIMLMTPADG